MTNPISITNLTPLDSPRASSPQEPLGSQDIGGKSSEQQFEGGFGTLLAQMLLGAAAQVPIAVPGGVGVLPEAKDAVETVSEVQGKPALEQSAVLSFGRKIPAVLQAQAKSVQGNGHTENSVTFETGFPVSLTEIATEEQGKQSGEIKATEEISLPAINTREGAEATVPLTEIATGEQGEQSQKANVTEKITIPAMNTREGAEATKGKITVLPLTEIAAGEQGEQSQKAEVTEKTTTPATNTRKGAEATKARITAVPLTEIAAGEQGEQSQKAEVTKKTNLPANNLSRESNATEKTNLSPNNLRESTGAAKGKVVVQGFSPALQANIETTPQHRSGKESAADIKKLATDFKETIVLQQNSGDAEKQSSQNPLQKVGAERANELKTRETKGVEPIVVPSPDTAVIAEAKKDFLKPAPAIVQAQIQPNPRTIKENQNEGETNAQDKEGQSKSLSAVKTAESSLSRDAVVKPNTASQGGRGTYQQFAQTSSEHVTANTSNRVVAEQPSPLTPELSKSIIDQITKELTFRIKDNVSEIRVSLKPESLGEVMINMQMEESKLTAQINVDQSNVKAAVESQLPYLRQTLAERGIEIHRIDVIVADQSLTRESRDQQSGKSKKRTGDGLTGIEEQDVTYSPRSLGYNTIELLI